MKNNNLKTEMANFKQPATLKKQYDASELAEFLDNFMEHRKISFADLYVKLKYSKQFLLNILNGYKLPSINFYDRMTNAFSLNKNEKIELSNILATFDKLYKKPLQVFMQKYRYRHNLTMQAMAKKIGWVGSYLSFMESEVKQVPDNMLEQLTSNFYFNEEEYAELVRILAKRKGKIQVNIDVLTPDKQEMIFALNEQVANLSSEDVAKIRNIVREAELSALANPEPGNDYVVSDF